MYSEWELEVENYIVLMDRKINGYELNEIKNEVNFQFDDDIDPEIVEKMLLNDNTQISDIYKELELYKKNTDFGPCKI